MADSAIGSALVIPESLLKDLDKADKKIQQIAIQSEETAKAFNTSFEGMALSVEKLIAALQTANSSIDGLSRITSISNDLNQATAGAESLAMNITKAAENVERLNASTKETANSAVVTQDAFNKIWAETDPKQALSINQMNEALKQLKETRANMTSGDKDYSASILEVSERIEELNAKMREATMTSEQLAKAHEKEEIANKKNAIAMARVEEQYKRMEARQEAQKAYQQNTTYTGSLQFAETAASINERTQAIKYLTAARNELNVADENYSSKLSTLNAKILEMNRANREATAGAKELVKHHKNLLDTSGQLARAFALIFSVSQIRGYISEMIKVRGEFELQQRSLEAILQDKPKADEIFNKTVQLAVQSPFQIRELVTYTKQLAAFRIESDKLYDTTKRLSDISAGLGVSMDRIILAYGQVKAAAFLRGQEVRQFTEAGINLYAELQKYYEEVRGEAYTTAQIVEMISKRMVTFEDVDAVFHRLTDEGGIFYRMQEIQAETLRGRLANLRDSFDIMLNSIGKSNEGILKGGIDVTKSLLQNWETIVTILEIVGGLFLMLKVRSLQTGVAMSKVFSQEFLTASQKGMRNMELLNYRVLSLRAGLTAAGKSLKLFGNSLISAFASNIPLLGVTALIGAFTNLVGWQRKTREATAELTKTFTDNMQPIYKMITAYNDLKNAADKASKSQDKVFDFEANTEDRRKLLRELVGRYRDSGFEINLDVSTVSDEDLDKVFKEYTDRFEEIERHIRSIGAIFNQVDNNFWEWVNVFNDSLNSDAKDLTDAETNLLLQESSIKKYLNLVGASYDELNQDAKEYYNSIKDGQKTTESYTEYLYRVYEALAKIREETDGKLYKEGGTFLDYVMPSAYQYSTALEEFLSEIDKVKKKIEQASIDDPVAIAAEIDRYAAENSWGETLRFLAKKAILGVKVEIDKDDAAEQIKGIKQQMDEQFANNTYNVTFLSNGLSSEEAFKDFDDKAQEHIKKLKKLISQRDHALKASSKIDNYNPEENAQEINHTVKQLIDWGYKDEVDAILNGGKKATKAAKGVERDIWQERINVLKEMNRQYNELRKTMSDEEAQQFVRQEYKNAAKYAGMLDVINYSSLNPTDKNVADLIDKWKELVAKTSSRLNAEKDVAKLRIGIDEEYFKKELARIEKDVDEAFNGLSLTERLTGLGLHDYQIKMMFPDIAVSFDQVAKRIRDDYEITEEMASMTNEELEKMMGTDKFKAYNSAVEKLDQQRLNQQRSTIEQLVKDYKNVLDEQVKLDVWYTKERNKIMSQEYNLDPHMQAEMNRNLDRQYQQQSQKIAWDDFTNSGFYSLMFSQIEYASKTSLELMRKKLEQIKDSMSDLDPENLKQIADLEKKIGEREVEVRPYQTLVASFKDMVSYLKERKSLEQELANLVQEEDTLTQQQRELSALINSYEVMLDEITEKADKDQQDITRSEELKEIINKLKDDYEDIVDALDKIRKKQNDINNTQKKGGEAQNKFNEAMGKFVEDMQSAVETIQVLGDCWDQIFGTGSDALHDTIDTMVEMGNASVTIAEGFKAISDGDWFKGITTSLQGTISLVSALFAIKDKRLERQIQRLQEETDNLAKAYDRLKDAMDDAYDISRLQTYRNETVKTLKAEIANYEEMIRLENEKKKTDKDKIKEYQEEIEDLYDTLAELEESFVESLGGFGSEANYKSAAEGFADAWMSAFRDSENALDALNEEFEDLFANLLQTQLTNRLAEAYIQPILDAMDDALVDENGNARDLDTMVKMLADAWAGIDEATEGYNAAATQIMDLLKDYGIDLTSGSSTSELSALQQGIEGVSEQTASALESILNSIRFFVAEQQADVAIIREYLVSSSVSGQTTESPMLIELQSQTAILRDMRTMWDRVIKPQTGGGYGVKVLGIS